MAALTSFTDSWDPDLEIDEFDYIYGCYDLGNWLYEDVLVSDWFLDPLQPTLPPDPLQSLDAGLESSWGHTPNEFWTLCHTCSPEIDATSKWSLDGRTYKALQLESSTVIVTGNCPINITFIHRQLVLERQWWLLHVTVEVWPPDYDPG